MVYLGHQLLIPIFGDALQFLLEALFNTGSWPTGSGTYNADTGQLTVTDSTDVMDMAGGVVSHSGFVAFGNPQFVSAVSYTRESGLTLLVSGFSQANRALIAWYNSGLTTSLLAAETGGSAIAQVNAENAAALKTSNSIAYDVALVLDSAGGNIYLRVANTGDFKLRWRDAVGTTSPVVARYAAISGTGARSINAFKVKRDTNGILINPTTNLASPVSGTTYTGTPSAVIDLLVTAPGVLSGSCELRFRVQDASNYYTAYFDSAGAFKLDRVISGTPSNLINVAGVIVGSGTRRIRAICDGNDVDCWTKNGATWTKRGGTINSSLLAAFSDIVPVAGAGWTIADLRGDPLFDSTITNLLNTWLARR